MLAAYLTGVGQYIVSLQQWDQGPGGLGAGDLRGHITPWPRWPPCPGSALTAVAGGLFGSVVGTVAVSAGATIGAALAFLVARYLARSSVEKWLEGNQKFQRLDRLTERQGAVMVAITRLVPLFPFNLLNFGFGLTRVPFWTYLIFSWLCMLPGTILYVVGFGRPVHRHRRGQGPLAAHRGGAGNGPDPFPAGEAGARPAGRRPGPRQPQQRGGPMSKAPEIGPLDQANREYLELTHPAGWTNPQPAEKYNLVVLGAGTAGLVCAAGAAGLGAKVWPWWSAACSAATAWGGGLCAEQVPHRLGPTRLARWRAPARWASRSRPGVKVDLRAAVMQRMRSIRARIAAHDSVQRFCRAGGWTCSSAMAASPARDTLEVAGGPSCASPAR